MRVTEKELDALISLIDDPDENVFLQVKERILAIGEPIVDRLETAWELSDQGIVFRNRIEDLLHTIHFERIETELAQWFEQENPSLLDGALIICRYRYAELDENMVKAKLAAMRQDVWLELTDGLTPFEQIRKMNSVLFTKHGLKGERDDYMAPRNSFLNEVLEKKSGNPLTLSMIYQIVAEGLNLPIRGVNLPKHFILAYLDDTSDRSTTSRPRFYINPFSSGDVLTEKEIDEFLVRTKIPKDSKFYLPCSNKEMILRSLINLLNAYEKAGDEERQADILNLLKKNR